MNRKWGWWSLALGVALASIGRAGLIRQAKRTAYRYNTLRRYDWPEETELDGWRKAA